MDKKPISETKTEQAKPINAAAIPTPSNLAETIKKHQFSISTEVVYSNIIYEAKPNANAASNNTHFNSNFVQSFSDGQIGNKYKLLSGSAQLGYSYKGGFGVNIGLGFFNIENKVDAKAFTQTKNSIVLDHYVYDSLGVIKDTIYKAGPSKNFVVVNGDTLVAQDYLNNIRFITIPLSFTYKIKLSNKFSLEPHAGFQFGIPLNSYQLVALKPTEFEYSKNKLFLKSTTFFDFALKVNYKIGSNAAIYLKQGYFFNNKSIYSADYALDYKLRNIYTSFGISIYLK
jgi:hypothetical protein